MATTFKTFLNNDVTTTKTLLHEAIPITGTIVSGAYGVGDKGIGVKVPVERNIRSYSHGMFQSVYDYPYLSSSANHIFDISVGLSTSSALSGSTKAFLTTADGSTAIGSGFGILSVSGNGLARTAVDTQFTSKVTVTQADLDNGSSIVTIVTPLGNTVTATAAGATVNVANSGNASGNFNNSTSDTVAAAQLALCLNAHDEILATASGGVVTVQFVSRAVDSHNNRFIGPVTQQEKKIAMYNQMAQVLMGHDKDGAIRRFDRDGQLNVNDTDKMDEVIFLNFSRLLTKDEIKKGSFQIKFETTPEHVSGKGIRGDFDGTTQNILTIQDTNAQNDFRINSPAGEYGILSASHTALKTTSGSAQGMAFGNPSHGSTIAGNVGLIFYQAGVCVLTASIFAGAGGGIHVAPVGGGGLLNSHLSMSISGVPNHRRQSNLGGVAKGSMSASVNQMLTGSTIDAFANNVRRRISNISFNNTTELNSTVYFCRANHNEFNYSSNPTYIKDSKLVVKDLATELPISFVTSVGLYSPDNELMAVAKLSEPLRKDPTNELTLRVRLDY